MVNCAVIIVSLPPELEGSILHHALFFILYSKGYNTVKCNESMWTPYGVLLGDFIFPVFWCGLHVVQMEQLESRWTPVELQMDSRQKSGWATTKEKMSKVHMDSRSWPGVHMESTWNMWGSVKSSLSTILLCPSHLYRFLMGKLIGYMFKYYRNHNLFLFCAISSRGRTKTPKCTSDTYHEAAICTKKRRFCGQIGEWCCYTTTTLCIFDNNNSLKKQTVQTSVTKNSGQYKVLL